VLAEWRVLPAGSSAAVALGGPARMTDRVLGETVFPPARTSSPARRAGMRADSGTPVWAFGGWGDGGGFGGDGGGCGGGGDGGGGGC
jgi:uncharacterized membrane protein YgcG